MNKKIIFLGSCFLLFTSCSSYFASSRSAKENHDIALDEMRLEIADVKHTLHTQQMEIALLEDKLQEKEQVISSLTKEMSGKKSLKTEQFFEEIASLERKLSHLEKVQDKMASDIKQLSSHANQTTSVLSQYREKIYDLQKEISSTSQKLDEIAKLKSTMTALSKALSAKTSSPGFIKYKVKPGDTLGKIAQDHHVSVEILKKHNELDNDRISVGRELKIPHGE